MPASDLAFRCESNAKKICFGSEMNSFKATKTLASSWFTVILRSPNRTFVLIELILTRVLTRRVF